VKAFDVLVVGAGPAGSTTALRLARAGMSVVIAEKEAFPRRKVCGEFISGPTWTLLRALGVGDGLQQHAGPPVERVGFFAREAMIEAPMPSRGAAPGRAVGRHHLDAALLQAAAAAGATVMQPMTIRGGEIPARLVVDAHGSWLRSPFGDLPAPLPSDLLGFKARFTAASLPRGLMPLVLFPGGYGGLVETDARAVSFSCCIRRDTLRSIRTPGDTAGEAIFAHVARHCRGFREALAGARLEDAWLAAGPIRPGFRALHRIREYSVGNAAGEAHPLIAEGISMAIQSGWLLARHLVEYRDPAEAGRRYARAWRRQFATRIRAADAFMRLTRSAPAMAFSMAAVRRFPAVLTWGAAWSGKACALEGVAA